MSSETTPLPRDEYQRRLEQRRSVHAARKSISDRLSAARGGVFLLAIALVVASALQWVPAWTVLLPAGVFVGLVVWHQRVAAEEGRAARAVRYYQTALERLDERWAGVGATGERYADPEHVYSGDLDLFGDGSLFQRLCGARTRLGEDRLAEWLCGPAEPDEIPRRQAAVDALRHALDFREELALLDADVHDALDQNRLRDWSAAAPRPFDGRTRLAALVLSALALGSLSGWLFFDLRLTWLIVFGLLLAAFLFAFRRRVSQLADEADKAASGLDILSQVLEVIERQEFRHPDLKALQGTLQTEGRKPSQHIAGLDHLIRGLNNTLRNQFFAVFGFLLALPVHLVHAIEVWRQHAGPHIPEWLDVVAELEALVSLSGYAYEEPRAVFPEIAAEGTCFDAEQLGHPLIPDALCVRNDLRLGPDRQLVLISGSNMSGKSTLLRTVGVNAVLAQAGGPVRAKRLRLSSLQIASAMRVHDSLQDGRSLFYAVLRRIKAIVDATEAGRRKAEGGKPTKSDLRPPACDLRPPDFSVCDTGRRGVRPLLFLLDEILQGTNSHDRRIGAEGVIRTLVERGAIGLVTTHDLALTDITASLDGRAVNCHFQDDLTDGRMTFDYQLRPGVVEKSNALELMRSMGLDV
jgi:predicted ATPase